MDKIQLESDIVFGLLAYVSKSDYIELALMVWREPLILTFEGFLKITSDRLQKQVIKKILFKELCAEIEKHMRQNTARKWYDDQYKKFRSTFPKRVAKRKALEARKSLSQKAYLLSREYWEYLCVHYKGCFYRGILIDEKGQQLKVLQMAIDNGNYYPHDTSQPSRLSVAAPKVDLQGFLAGENLYNLCTFNTHRTLEETRFSKEEGSQFGICQKHLPEYLEWNKECYSWEDLMVANLPPPVLNKNERWCPKCHHVAWYEDWYKYSEGIDAAIGPWPTEAGVTIPDVCGYCKFCKIAFTDSGEVWYKVQFVNTSI